MDTAQFRTVLLGAVPMKASASLSAMVRTGAWPFVIQARIVAVVTSASKKWDLIRFVALARKVRENEQAEPLLLAAFGTHGVCKPPIGAN